MWIELSLVKLILEIFKKLFVLIDSFNVFTFFVDNTFLVSPLPNQVSKGLSEINRRKEIIYQISNGVLGPPHLYRYILISKFRYILTNFQEFSKIWHKVTICVSVFVARGQIGRRTRHLLSSKISSNKFPPIRIDPKNEHETWDSHLFLQREKFN